MDSSNVVTCKVTEGERHSVTLKLEGWHKIKDFLVAAYASTVISWGNPEVSIRYTIKPSGKETYYNFSSYGFYAEPMQWAPNTTVSVNVSCPSYNSSQEKWVVVKHYKTITNEEGAAGKPILLIETLLEFENQFLEGKSEGVDLTAVKNGRFAHANLPNEIFVDINSMIFRQCYENDPTHRLEASGASGLTDSVSLLTDHISEMYAAPDNLADLALEMKDGMTLNGHRFILSARSPTLKRNIAEISGLSSGQSIKLDISAKPMTLVLHWMYTEKLHENIGKCWDQVLDAAKNLEMEEFCNLLEKQVMTLVTPENMLEMYQIAKKNNMRQATKEIAAYIKENLQD